MSSDFWNFYWCLHFLPKLAFTLGICEFLNHFERTVCTEHELDGFFHEHLLSARQGANDASFNFLTVPGDYLRNPFCLCTITNFSSQGKKFHNEKGNA